MKNTNYLRKLSSMLALISLLLLAPIATEAFPISVDVEFICPGCGGSFGTKSMKYDTGADGTTLSRADAIACGLLNADSTANVGISDTLKARNASGDVFCYLKSVPLCLEGTDSDGNVCKVTACVIMPIKGGKDVSSLLGSDFIGALCVNSKPDCTVTWNDWTPPPPDTTTSKIPVTFEPSGTPSDRNRIHIKGAANGSTVTWAYTAATKYIVLGSSTATALGLKGTGTLVDLFTYDNDLYNILDSDGFLGSIDQMFEVVTLTAYSIGTGADEVKSEDPVVVLINPHSDENLISQHAINELPGVTMSSMIISLDCIIVHLCTPDIMPTNLNTLVAMDVTGMATLSLSWDPVPNSIGCQVSGGAAGGGMATVIVDEYEANSLNIVGIPLDASTSYVWKVRCACEISPTGITDYTPLEPIPVPVLRQFALIEELYPNPAASVLQLNVVALRVDEISINVQSLTGQLVLNKEVPLAMGSNTIPLDVHDLPNGVYTVDISAGDEIHSEQFTVAR